MKALNYVFGAFISVAMIIVLLLTSVEVIAFKDLNFYKNQYVENGVYSNIAISEENLMDVTKELLRYMEGKRDNLLVITIVNGEQKEFF